MVDYKLDLPLELWPVIVLHHQLILEHVLRFRLGIRNSGSLGEH